MERYYRGSYSRRGGFTGTPVEVAKSHAFIGEFCDRDDIREQVPSEYHSHWKKAASHQPLNAAYQHRAGKSAPRSIDLPYFLAALQIEPGNQQFWRDYIAACGRQNTLPQLDVIGHDVHALKRNAAYPECTPQCEAHFLARVLQIQPDDKAAQRRYKEVNSFWSKIF